MSAFSVSLTAACSRSFTFPVRLPMLTFLTMARESLPPLRIMTSECGNAAGQKGFMGYLYFPHFGCPHFLLLSLWQVSFHDKRRRRTLGIEVRAITERRHSLSIGPHAPRHVHELPFPVCSSRLDGLAH